jgi:hypothetical protein
MNSHIAPELLRLYKLAMLIFALQVIYMSAGLYLATSLEIQFMSIAGLSQPILLWAIFPLYLSFIVVPIILTFVTYYALYVPEKNLRPSKNAKSWSLLLTFLGLVFGLVIGGIVFAKAHNKIKNSE